MADLHIEAGYVFASLFKKKNSPFKPFGLQRTMDRVQVDVESE